MERLVLAAVALASVACAGPERYGPFDPRPVQTIEQWEVRAGDRLLGHVELLEIDDPVAPQRYYRVRNAADQWLGYADEKLRFFQRVPFSMTEVFIGIHPMEEGLALLLEYPGPVSLVPSGGAAEEAAVGR